MAGTNTASQFSPADVEGYIATETLPLARRQLVAYQFGDPLTLPEGRGTTYTATRFNRVPLPFSPISEGSPPPGQTMTLAQVSATAQQWGDRIIITDVAELTIKHPLFKKAMELIALQVSETFERNTMNALMGGTQVNTAGGVGSRAALIGTSVIKGADLNRATAQLLNLGAPRYMGDEMTNTKLDADAGGERASDDPRGMPHYVAIMHPFVSGDFYNDNTIVTALSYSDINRLYNAELGEWRGVRIVQTNLVPSFTGFAALTPAAQAGGGSFAANSFFFVVTASDTQNQYESRIYQTTAGVAIAASGSATLVLPALPGFTYSVYVGLSTTVTNLATCATGPTYGPLTGQATQLAPGTTVTLTGVGATQTPPAPPATGVTVYPTFVIGRGAYGQVVLSDVQFSYLKDADKSDPLNQLRIVGWKAFYGTLIENQNFFMRIESASAITSTFN